MVDQDGIITIIDHKKDAITRGGENISCLNEDAALHLHPAVAEAAVFLIPHEKLGETVGATVKLYPNHSLIEERFQAYLDPHLVAFKIPEKN